MNFSVISEEEAKSKFEKASNKLKALKIIADLTASSKKEAADFLGVKLLKKYPWISV